jgi:hypothetical protein
LVAVGGAELADEKAMPREKVAEEARVPGVRPGKLLCAAVEGAHPPFPVGGVVEEQLLTTEGAKVSDEQQSSVGKVTEAVVADHVLLRLMWGVGPGIGGAPRRQVSQNTRGENSRGVRPSSDIFS